MNESWIFQKAHNTKFRDHEKDSQIVFEQYMLDFRKQLKNGKIHNLANKE